MPKLWITEVIALADLDAVVAQDVVSRGHVEVKVGNCMTEQELHPFVLGFLLAALDDNFLVLGTVDLRRRHRLDKGDRLSDARLQLL